MLKRYDAREKKEKAAPHHSAKDQIEYISDLLLELKAMAGKNDLPTLAGILDLAYAEARRRSKDHP